MRRCRSGEDGQSTWYFFLLLCCGANLALAIVLGNMNYRQAVKWSCHKSSMQVSRTDLLIQSKISKQLCLCLLEIRWGHVKGFRRCGFDEEVRAIVQSRTNMVPFMDVNNMNGQKAKESARQTCWYSIYPPTYVINALQIIFCFLFVTQETNLWTLAVYTLSRSQSSTSLIPWASGDGTRAAAQCCCWLY